MKPDFGRFIPKFRAYREAASGPFRSLFDFGKIWKQAVFLCTGVALTPLILMALIDYNVTRHAIESEILLRTSRLVSNERRTISFFLEERKFALEFVVHDNPYETLKDAARLAAILDNLRKALGGFSDLGVIDSSGIQVSYTGPYSLLGVDYRQQDWFRQVMEKGVYVSDVFLGLRNAPHFVIAVKHMLPNGDSFILRSSLDMERFQKILSQMELEPSGDAVIINRSGILQTPSRYFPDIFSRIPFSIPDFSQTTQVYQTSDAKGRIYVIGYAYIVDTPFILMVTKQKSELMKPWFRTLRHLVVFLAVSVVGILAVIIGVATYLVNHMYMADQKRVMTLHQVEYANKLASIGRLAAGVAHEINNPLAIINEKAGLIKDIFTFRSHYAGDAKLAGLIDGIIASVERCGAITRRLLGFARHMEVRIQNVNLGVIIQDVIGFLGKEAEYKSITVSVEIPEDVPEFESDRGKLQQIFLNLVNNAFAAMNDGGHLNIAVGVIHDKSVSVTVSDDGCGIAGTDLKRVFEPFFTTKGRSGGTGLGLSITYGLVQELGGDIQVASTVGRGTRFTVTLPLARPPQGSREKKKGETDAGIAG